ncbi:MAG: hypothetical protein NTX00_03835 [Candidatus Parcubacteria bacterium]|nr:hypothetical protein [Candidatus Parcubacteria bacterium]
MRIPKKAANWFIALLHYLIGGFIMPGFVALIGSVIIMPVFIIFAGTANSTAAILTLIIASLILTPLGIWYGVKYSASVLKGGYIITDPNAVINLSTIYRAIIPTLYLIYAISKGGMQSTQIIINILSLVVSVILFYIFSKKYFSMSQATPETQIQS